MNSISSFPDTIDLTAAEFPVTIIECKSHGEWLAARRLRLQASDTAAILGVGYRNQSPATVWESKVSDSGEKQGNQAKYLRIGKMMESSLRLIFSEETGLPTFPVGEFTIYCHPFIPWLGCTLDLKTIHDEYGLCPVELKNVSYFNREDWDDGKTPLKFAIQLQHQLAVTGASHGFLFGLIGGNEPIVRLIERDEAFIDVMLEALGTFWRCVERKELPPIDGTEATAGVLKRLYGKDDGNTTMLPRDAAEWAIQRETAAAVIKSMKVMQTTAENHLKAELGSFTFGDLPGRADYKGAADRVATMIHKEVERIGAMPAPLAYSWKTQIANFEPRPARESESRVFRACK